MYDYSSRAALVYRSFPFESNTIDESMIFKTSQISVILIDRK